MYDESIKRKVDLFNVQSADYKSCNAVDNKTQKARKTNCAYKPTPFLCNNASLEWENCVRHGEWFAKRYYLASRSRWTLSRKSPHHHHFKQTKRKCDIATLWQICESLRPLLITQMRHICAIYQNLSAIIIPNAK